MLRKEWRGLSQVSSRISGKITQRVCVSQKLFVVKLKFPTNAMSMERISPLSVLKLSYSGEDNWCILSLTKILRGIFLQFCCSEISPTWYNSNLFRFLFIHTTSSDLDLDPRSLSWQKCTVYNYMYAIWLNESHLSVWSLVIHGKIIDVF